MENHREFLKASSGAAMGFGLSQVPQRSQAQKSPAIWHNNSFNPIYRAEQDVHEISKYSGFLKIVIYHNCGGERMAGYIDSVSKSTPESTKAAVEAAFRGGAGGTVQNAAREKA